MSDESATLNDKISVMATTLLRVKLKDSLFLKTIIPLPAELTLKSFTLSFTFIVFTVSEICQIPLITASDVV